MGNMNRRNPFGDYSVDTRKSQFIWMRQLGMPEMTQGHQNKQQMIHKHTHTHTSHATLNTYTNRMRAYREDQAILYIFIYKYYIFIIA